MNPTVEMRLPGRPLISRMDAQEVDASNFYQVLANHGYPDLDVERFAAEDAYNLHELGEGDVLFAVSTYPDKDETKYQKIEITRSGQDFRVQFVGNVAIEGADPVKDDRPTGFILSDPINGSTAKMLLGNDYPGLKHGYYFGGRAYFEGDGVECPNWAFGPIQEVVVIPADTAA